jgi:uncharacterized protein (DUF1684 family)
LSDEPADAAAPEPDPYVVEALRYRQARLARLTSETGWLTLTGRTVLAHGDNRFPVGTFTVSGDGTVRFTPAAGAAVTMDGRPVDTSVSLSPVNDGPAVVFALAAASAGAGSGGPASIRHELVRRAGAFIVRTRDPQSADRRTFPGTDWFPPRAEWRLAARFEPAPRQRTLALGYDIGEDSPLSPGSVTFDGPGGARGRLDLLWESDETRARLYVLFGDETNRDETYSGGRFFYAAPPHPPDEAGTVVLDFNLALNPPCAFTPFATCPLPPAGNRLPFRVDAGERRFVGR